MIGEPERKCEENQERHPPPCSRKAVIVRVFRALKRQINRICRHRDKNETPHQINERMMARWTRHVGWFTGALVVISAVTTSIFWRQLNVMQGQLDESKRTLTELERPYIFVDIPTFTPNKIEGLAPNVQYVLQNYGRTPAIVIWLKATTSQTGPPSNKIVNWTEFFNGQIVFKPGERQEIQPLHRFPYPNYDPAIGRPPILFIINVTYLDVFDYVHCSEFTFFESEGYFYAIGGKKYNHSKSEKLPDTVEWTPAWSEKFCAEPP
jgi:hypothetical protein